MINSTTTIKSIFGSGRNSSPMMKAAKAGLGETFGWQYQGWISPKNEGFLGLKTNIARIRASGTKIASISGAGRLAGKTALSTLGSGGTFGLATTALMAYQGYKEQGIWGATKGVAESALWNIGPRMAVSGIGQLGPLAFLAGVGIGGYALGQAGRAYGKRIRGLEMGGGGQIIDALSSAGAATSRQRSMMALNNTHLNGRSALGNEAFMMHTSFR